MGKMDSKVMPSVTGAKAPKGATSSDASGERHGRLKGGVAEGKEDGGSEKEFNTGRTSGVCYNHERKSGKDW